MQARIFANIGCWLLIFPLVLAVMLYPFSFWHLHGTFTDGNAYTDPLAMILSYLAPIGVAGATGFVALWQYGMTTKKRVIIAAVICLCFTFAPVIFGIWLWHEWNVLHFFSLRYWAWWLQPTAILWLSAYSVCLATLNASFIRKPNKFTLAILYTCSLSIIGATLAWVYISNDFTLNLVNGFAVIPFAVACLSLIRIIFFRKENHASPPEPLVNFQFDTSHKSGQVRAVAKMRPFLWWICPLSFACCAAMILLVVALPGLVGYDKTRAIDDAIESGNLEKVKALLKNHPDLVSNKDENGETPLTLAALSGRAYMVQVLLANGADVNSTNRSGTTPLHYAGNATVAELLLSKKAEVDARAQDGVTPLYTQVQDGHKDVVELLLAHGADPNAKTSDGETPLYIVQNVGMAELLLAHGADVKVKDNFGDTLLHLAAWDKAITELWLANHVDINARDNNGETPLHTAAQSSLEDIVGVLLAHGADVNAKDNQGCTPLHYAAEYGSQDIVQFLLAHGADANAKDNKGETPLFLAESKAKVNWTSEEVAEWLHHHGGHE